MLELGVDVVTLTEGILRAAVAMGKHSIDVSLIIGPIIHELIKSNADVTGIVAANGNGTYTLSNLDLTNNIFTGSPYCNQTTDYGGWSIIVIYEEDGLALNQISLFDGLEVVYQNELIITLGPLNVASDLLAKIGFLAWEGDLPNPNNEK